MPSDRRQRLIIAAALVAGLVVFDTWDPQGQTAVATRWYKGNTHTHTLNSDGDSTPDDVVRWYRGHGYQFLVLTDHNFLTSVDGLNALHGADEKFLVIKGEEVTDRFEKAPIHINGLDVADVTNALRALMVRKMGIVRDRHRLDEAAADVGFWCRYVLAREFDNRPGWELQNLLTIARLMIEAARTRTESRGTHFRSDYPQPDDAHWLRHVVSPPRDTGK